MDTVANKAIDTETPNFDLFILPLLESSSLELPITKPIDHSSTPATSLTAGMSRSR